MGVLTGGILGCVRNKVGGIVGSTWRGKCYTKAYQPDVENPQTEAQQKHRAIYGFLTTISRVLTGYLFPWYWNPFVKDVSGQNQWVSENYKIIKEDFPTILTTKLNMARGNYFFPTVGFMYSYVVATDIIIIAWDVQLLIAGVWELDSVIDVIYIRQDIDFEDKIVVQSAIMTDGELTADISEVTTEEEYIMVYVMIRTATKGTATNSNALLFPDDFTSELLPFPLEDFSIDNDPIVNRLTVHWDSVSMVEKGFPSNSHVVFRVYNWIGSRNSLLGQFDLPMAGNTGFVDVDNTEIINGQVELVLLVATPAGKPLSNFWNGFSLLFNFPQPGGALTSVGCRQWVSNSQVFRMLGFQHRLFFSGWKSSDEWKSIAVSYGIMAEANVLNQAHSMASDTIDINISAVWENNNKSYFGIGGYRSDTGTQFNYEMYNVQNEDFNLNFLRTQDIITWKWIQAGHIVEVTVDRNTLFACEYRTQDEFDLEIFAWDGEFLVQWYDEIQRYDADVFEYPIGFIRENDPNLLVDLRILATPLWAARNRVVYEVEVPI